jgi:hypothetical protein
LLESKTGPSRRGQPARRRITTDARAAPRSEPSHSNEITTGPIQGADIGHEGSATAVPPHMPVRRSPGPDTTYDLRYHTHRVTPPHAPCDTEVPKPVHHVQHAAPPSRPRPITKPISDPPPDRIPRPSRPV